jgi:hypothetical protein
MRQYTQSNHDEANDEDQTSPVTTRCDYFHQSSYGSIKYTSVQLHELRLNL